MTPNPDKAYEEGVLHGLRSAAALVEQFENIGSSWPMLSAALAGMIAALEADERRCTSTTKSITPTLLADVAKWYREGGAALVQERTGMSRSTAHRYVARARAAGLLPSNEHNGDDAVVA